MGQFRGFVLLMAAFCFIACILFSTATPLVAEPVIENYLIHANDVLEISVWGVEGMNKSVTVRPDGKITFTLVGDIVALGKTTEELTKDIEQKLLDYVKEPQVTVILSKFNHPNVYILGEVENPGPYELTDPNMLLELLAQAKLVHPNISEHSVSLLRRGVLTQVPLVISVDSPQNISNYKLKQGDIIYISFQGRPVVYLYGDVKNPGEYPIPEDPSNIVQMLAMAGEMNTSILKYGVTLIRDKDITELNLMTLPEGFELMTGDVVLVPATKSDSITVSGSVAKPGIYTYFRGSTILDVIQQAGGFSNTADQDGVKIYRNYPDAPTIIDVGNLFAPEGNKNTLQVGDVVLVQKKKVSFGNFFTDKLLPAIRDITIIDQVLR